MSAMTMPRRLSLTDKLVAGVIAWWIGGLVAFPLLCLIGWVVLEGGPVLHDLGRTVHPATIGAWCLWASFVARVVDARRR